MESDEDASHPPSCLTIYNHPLKSIPKVYVGSTL